MNGQIIKVKAKAGASRREVKKNPDGTFTVWTTRPPDRGQANRDIIVQLSEHLDIAQTRIELISGQTSPLKKFKIV